MDYKSYNDLGLGDGPHEYEPDLWRPAGEIQVDKLRLILTWPLVLRIFPTENGERIKDISKRQDNYLRQVKSSLNDGPWKHEEDLANYAAPPNNIFDPDLMHPAFEALGDKANKYGEFVYFHDFVQETLYSRASQDYPNFPLHPVTLYKRFDIKRIAAKFYQEKDIFSINAGVENVNLHLFGTGAAMISVELEFGLNPMVHGATRSKPMMLSHAQTIIDQIRRTYTPYYDVGMSKEWNSIPAISSGLIPIEFKWLDENGFSIADPKLDVQPYSATGEGNFRNLNQFLDQSLKGIHKPNSEGRRNLPLLNHWRDLAGPLRIDGDRATKDESPIFRQVTDERIPMMSYISIGNIEGFAQKGANRLRSIRRGDWVRLCFADGPGSDPLPYSANFLRDFETKHCYDRFAPSSATSSATRYMFSGGNMCMVTEGDFSNTVLVHHFRRHYYQLALVINMEFASLLATSSHVSAALRRFKSGPKHTFLGRALDYAKEKELTENLRFAERSFLEFTHLYHFGGLSNQIQAREIFEMWRGHAGIDKIYQEVKEEVQAGNEFLRNEELVHQANAAKTLNIILSIVAAVGLVFSFFGMNVFFGGGEDTSQLHKFNQADHWALFSGVLSFSAISAFISALVYGAIYKFRNYKLVFWLGVLSAISFLKWWHSSSIAALF